MKSAGLLTRIRRAVYLGSIHSRDYMLSNRADQLETLRTQLREVKTEARAGLDELQVVAGAGGSFAAVRGPGVLPQPVKAQPGACSS